MATEAYSTISEIWRPDTEELLPPLEEWRIEVEERGLQVDLGDVGGRESLVANARVEVTEPDGSTWTGLTRLRE